MKTNHALGVFTLATLAALAACAAPTEGGLGTSGRSSSSSGDVDPDPGTSSGGSSSGGSSSGGSSSGGSSSGGSSSGGSSSGGSSSGEPPPAGAGTGSVTGKVFGASVTSKDTTGYVEPGELTVKITDYEGACGLEQRNGKKKNTLYVKLNVKGGAGGLAKIVAGKYPVIGNGSEAVAVISAKKFDGTCAETSVIATAGSITFTKVGDSAAEGTFEATIANEKVTGSFSTPLCAVSEKPKGPCE